MWTEEGDVTYVNPFFVCFFLVSKEICDIKIWQFKNKQIKWKTDMIIYENVYMRWSQAFK